MAYRLGGMMMTWSKKTKERMWRARKNASNPPTGKGKSLKQLAEEGKSEAQE